MISHVKTVMKTLIDNPVDLLPDPIVELSQRRWMTGNEDGPIVQIEPFDDGKSGLLFSIAARDGSGALRASFLTMLLLEDTFATAQVPYGVCSGEATVTVYRHIDLENVTATQLAQAMQNFAGTAERVLGAYCGTPVVEISPDGQSAA